MSGSLAAPPLAGDEGFAEIGGCRLIQRLDSGGACAVYLARQPRLGNRLVVVKLTPLRADGNGQGRDLQEELLRQARVLGRLTHPNILPLYDAGVARGWFYLVTQYVPDGSLSAALRGSAPRGRLALPARPRFVADLIGQVAAALHYLHAHGLVHGAVGPAYVLLHAQPDGRWRALLADAGLLPDTEGKATPAKAGAARTPADDQAALAALAYLLLAGRAPAPPALPAEPDAPPAAPRDHAAALIAANPAVPKVTARAIARALAPDHAVRFATVADFAHVCTQALDQAPDQARPLEEQAAPALPGRPSGAAGSRGISVPLTPSQRRIKPQPPLRRTRAASPSRRARDVTGGGLAVPGTPPAHAHARHRGALGLVGLVLLLGALVLAIRLPNDSIGPAGANGQPGGAANQGVSQQVGVAGGQLTIASGATAPTASVAAAAPPPTPIGQGDRATPITLPAAVTTAPDQPFTASFTLLNSGASTWSAAGGYVLVCDRVRHPDASCASAIQIGFGPYVIAPGQRVRFTVDLIAPVAPGTYLLWWNLAHAGHIFASPDVALSVVVSLPPQPTATPTLTPSGTPSATPSATPSVTPDPSPTGSPTASPSAGPGAMPIVTPLTTLPPLG